MLAKVEIQDIEEILTVIKTSILACELDHQNDPSIIESWLKNKTSENLSHWLDLNPSIKFCQNSQIVGILMWSPQGEILLNYVLPNFQSQGIGKKMLDFAKLDCYKAGLPELKVESTITAKPFYQKNDFTFLNIDEDGEIVGFEMQFSFATAKQQIDSLTHALNVGSESGIYANFDPELHLKKLKSRVTKNH